MPLITDLLQNIQDGTILKVVVGLHWTAVLVDVDGVQNCGLASTLTAPHEHHGDPDVPEAGSLTDLPVRVIASLALEHSKPVQRSIGIAALNALLPIPEDDTWIEGNAERVIATQAAGKQVAIVGDFPFVSRLHQHVGAITVIDRRPHEGVLPEKAAAEVLPRSDFIAITGMAIINQSLEDLLSLCPDDAMVMVLGPSTPLTPILFEYGVDLISGAIVQDHQAVMRAIEQGANFRQVHKAGVQLVTLGCNPSVTASLLTARGT
jgi:uncharacterized protein (DUF4213/DUF364 family)